MFHEIEFACDLSVVAWKSYQKGNTETAKTLYRRALGLFQRASEETMPETVAVLNRLGLILENNREYTDAEHCYQHACKMLESVKGDKRIDRLKVRSLYHLGRIRRLAGYHNDAEDLLTTAMNYAEEKLGRNDPEYAHAANQLAILLRYTKDFQRARILYYRALRILEAKLGVEHPTVASVYRNLSELEYAAGRYKKGEPFARRAIIIRMKILGAEHPDLASDLSILACLLKAQGQFDEAEKLYRRALLIAQAKYGEDHYEAAVHLTNLASLHAARGESAEAEWLYWQALTIKEKTLGSGHLDCALTMVYLTDLYKSQGRYDEAQLLCERALSDFEKILKPDDSHIISCRKTLKELTGLLDRTTTRYPV